MKQIQPGSFLTLHYRLSGLQGDTIINTFDGPPATLTLGLGELAPAIEQRLIGLNEGVHAVFDIPAGETFGQRNPEMQQKVKLSLLQEMGEADATYAVGDVVHFPTPDGQSQYAGLVREINEAEGWLLFDFNHPLAGQAVRFEVQVIGVL